MTSPIEILDQSFILRKPVVSSAIRRLSLEPGSRGLDIGCGTGQVTALLADSIMPGGHVTGVDVSADMVEHANQLAAGSGLSDGLDFRIGDMRDLPFEKNTFDWAWSMDLVGYIPLDPLPLMGEMMRVVRSGGLIAVCAWSSEQLLPGYPALESLLGATSSGIAPFSAGKDPSTHFLRAAGWMRELGLQDICSSTIAGDARAPLGDDKRAALESLIGMRWTGVERELSEEDWRLFQRLCSPDSPDFILDNPDYYAFFTYTIFSGLVP